MRCPTCLAQVAGQAPPLQAAGPALLRCPRCDRRYPLAAGGGYVDLMPRAAADLGHTSRYVADLAEFAERLDYREMAPPLLGAAVRNRLLHRMLHLTPRDRVLELGCGNGKFLLWNRDRVAWSVGLDPAPLFADEAVRRLDLVQGDARLLPFPDRSFSKLWSIDVLEHLARPDIDRYLAEAYRVLAPGGRLFIFSNTRERGPFDLLVSGSRRLANWLARQDLADPRRDLLRKSDHLKVLETWEDVVTAVTAAGFELRRVVYWNGVFQSFLDNVLLRVAERLLVRLRGNPTSRLPSLSEKEAPDSPPRAGEGLGERSHQDALGQGALAARSTVRARLGHGGPLLWLLRALTALMWLDIVLFGRFRTGPYFVLLRKPPRPP
ncbi:MAG TPA: class I SAM-dependent methyltransferase [Chloroflexia bacterium]|nr:class I SAM-dependent methyltransferase [Chloroflexia bacterium]